MEDSQPGVNPLSQIVVMGEHHSVSKLPPVTVSKIHSEAKGRACTRAPHSCHAMEATSGGGRKLFSTADKDSSPLGSSLASKSLINLLPYPDVQAQSHEKIDYWDHLVVLMSTVPGLTEVSLGQQPALVRELMDTDMDEIPELPPDHPRYEQRREARVKVQKENDILNALKRYSSGSSWISGLGCLPRSM